jgi:hypothetical protein
LGLASSGSFDSVNPSLREEFTVLRMTRRLSRREKERQ